MQSAPWDDAWNAGAECSRAWDAGTSVDPRKHPPGLSEGNRRVWTPQPGSRSAVAPSRPQGSSNRTPRDRAGGIYDRGMADGVGRLLPFRHILHGAGIVVVVAVIAAIIPSVRGRRSLPGSRVVVR